MAESREGNPTANIKKTVVAQEKRVGEAEKHLTFDDNFSGEQVTGRVESYFNKDIGGSVNTEMWSGNASMKQFWNFDKKGDLTNVQVTKSLADKIVKNVLLRQGPDGKFIAVISQSSGPTTFDWDEEFNTVRKRTQSPKK